MKSELVIAYLHRFLGQPYCWGGDGRQLKGFDCSGLIQEGLASVGMWDGLDRTSQQIFKLYSGKVLEYKKLDSEFLPGTLLFFGKDIDKITHVAITINFFQMLEAGGGNSRPGSGGMVRIRPYSYRKDLVAALNPFERS